MSEFIHEIQKGRYPNAESRTIQVEMREGGWYVNTTEIDGEGWRIYAVPAAGKRDVKQLLNKEYDDRY
jgi:hypothetical protein